MKQLNFKKCPLCGSKIKICGGPENWKPTLYDPDSGGDPYYIVCNCGLEFCIGYCEISQLEEKWNKRIP